MKVFLKNNYIFVLTILVIQIAVLNSCTQANLFEKNTTIPNLKWQSNYNATGSIEITDTTSLYNVYLVLRHTDAYNYNNIWLNIGLQTPGDSMLYQKINFTLGNDATGWEGIGMSDIWEVRKPISGIGMAFTKKGTYHFSIAHIMRDNPLPNIMSVGMRLEKIK